MARASVRRLIVSKKRSIGRSATISTSSIQPKACATGCSNSSCAASRRWSHTAPPSPPWSKAQTATTLIAAAHQRHVRCARWVLALAGLEADGMTGQARAQGLGVIIGQARAAWRGDSAGDFAKTMASLDRNLRRAEEMFGRWAGFEAKPKADDATPP